MSPFLDSRKKAKLEFNPLFSWHSNWKWNAFCYLSESFRPVKIEWKKLLCECFYHAIRRHNGGKNRDKIRRWPANELENVKKKTSLVEPCTSSAASAAGSAALEHSPHRRAMSRRRGSRAARSSTTSTSVPLQNNRQYTGPSSPKPSLRRRLSRKWPRLLYSRGLRLCRLCRRRRNLTTFFASTVTTNDAPVMRNINESESPVFSKGYELGICIVNQLIE